MIRSLSKPKQLLLSKARWQTQCINLGIEQCNEKLNRGSKSYNASCSYKHCSLCFAPTRNLHIVRAAAKSYSVVPRCLTQSINSYSTDVKDIDTRCLTPLPGEVDRYKGIWVNLSHMKTNVWADEFEALLKASLSCWRHAGLHTAWLQVAIAQGEYMAVAARHGFKFHHAEGQMATLVLCLDATAESKVPMFASHQVGVSGVVIKEDTKEVLVVQDKGRRYTLWKFPGGLSDLGEDIATTAEREVFEETGLKTEFQSILAFRQQHDHPGAFGRSDLYILCRLKPLTFDLHPCAEEISACQWMSLDQLKTEAHASSITHRTAALVEAGLTHGWDAVDICSTKMESIVMKGKLFHMFNRPLS